MRRLARSAILAVVLASSPVAAQDPPPPPPAAEPPLYETTVTATTPLHGSGLPIDHVPANVQTSTGARITKAQSLDLSG